MAAVVMSAMVFSACSGSAEPSAREADKDVAEETEETTEDPEEAMAAYKAECQEFDYRDYFGMSRSTWRKAEAGIAGRSGD